MQTTSNLGLRKPDDDAFINIEDLNYNSDIIDQKVQEALEKTIEVVNDYSGGEGKAASAEIVKNLKESVDGKASKEDLADKLGKTERASDSDRLDGHDSNYFATLEYAQTAKNKADSAYEKAEAAFTQASEGKTLIANTLTGKGIPTDTESTWDTIKEKIEGIDIIGNEDDLVERIEDFGIPYYLDSDVENLGDYKNKILEHAYPQETFTSLNSINEKIRPLFDFNSLYNLTYGKRNVYIYKGHSFNRTIQPLKLVHNNKVYVPINMKYQNGKYLGVKEFLQITDINTGEVEFLDLNISTIYGHNDLNKKLKNRHGSSIPLIDFSEYPVTYVPALDNGDPHQFLKNIKYFDLEGDYLYLLFDDNLTLRYGEDRQDRSLSYVSFIRINLNTKVKETIFYKSYNTTLMNDQYLTKHGGGMMAYISLSDAEILCGIGFKNESFYTKQYTNDKIIMRLYDTNTKQIKFTKEYLYSSLYRYDPQIIPASSVNWIVIHDAIIESTLPVGQEHIATLKKININTGAEEDYVYARNYDRILRETGFKGYYYNNFYGLDGMVPKIKPHVNSERNTNYSATLNNQLYLYNTMSFLIVTRKICQNSPLYAFVYRDGKITGNSNLLYQPINEESLNGILSSSELNYLDKGFTRNLEDTRSLPIVIGNKIKIYSDLFQEIFESSYSGHPIVIVRNGKHTYRLNFYNGKEFMYTDGSYWYNNRSACNETNNYYFVGYDENDAYLFMSSFKNLAVELNDHNANFIFEGLTVNYGSIYFPNPKARKFSLNRGQLSMRSPYPLGPGDIRHYRDSYYNQHRVFFKIDISRNYGKSKN